MNAPVDISAVTLRTPRLALRPWRLSDLEDLYAYACVDGVGQMAGWPPHRSRTDSLDVLSRFIAEKKTFALEYQGRVVGSLGLEEYNESQFPEFAALRCREIGYALSKDCWGRGLMPEAVEEALRYLFEEAELDAVFCGHFLSNVQSARVQKKCGFSHYGYGKFQTRMGTTEDEEINLLTRADYFARRETARL